MNRSLFVRLAAALLAVAWLFIVTFNYYIGHKPFGVDNLLAIGSAAGDVVTASALVILGLGLGRRMTRSFDWLPLEGLVFRGVLGLGLISLLTLGLGLAGLLDRPVFWALLLAGLFLLRSDHRANWRDWRSLTWPLESGVERVLLLFVAFSLVIGFLFALTPPVGWDTQTYHLVQARVAIDRGRIVAPPDILYFSFPSLVEMLFLAAMVLKGDIAAQLIHYSYFLLALLSVFAFGRRYWSDRVAWLACAVMVAVPSLLTVATWAYVDLALVAYALTAFYALMLARDSGDVRMYALSGALAGLAMGVKYTAAIVPIALFVVMLLSPLTRKWRFLFIEAGCAAATAAPWYLRNLVFTGNPVYPFVFGGAFWDAFRAEWFSRFGSGLVTNPLQLLTAPWDATMLGREGGLGYEATVGPILLALVPLLLITLTRRNRDRVLADMAVYTGVLYAFWLTGIAESKLLLQTRLLFPAFPFFALAAAVALERLGELDLPQFSVQRFARLLVLLVMALSALTYGLAFAASSPLPVITGAETRPAFLAKSLGGYDRAIQFINTQLPADASVLALWEPRSYYVKRTIQPDAILDIFPHLFFQYQDADRIAAAVQERGYTHVLLSRVGLDYQLQSGYDPITLDQVNALQTLAARGWRLVYGQSPLEITSRDGRPSIVNADGEPYAVYEIVRAGVK